MTADSASRVAELLHEAAETHHTAFRTHFDLSSYEDVRANAELIYERLADGTMPCYGPWPADNVERFTGPRLAQHGDPAG
jgi:hypothetical protein